MYNYFVLLGKIRQIHKNGVIELAVKNEFRNLNGEFGYEYIKVVPHDFVAEMAKDQLQVGNVICVKGRITSDGSGYLPSGNITLNVTKIMKVGD